MDWTYIMTFPGMLDSSETTWLTGGTPSHEEPLMCQQPGA